VSDQGCASRTLRRMSLAAFEATLRALLGETPNARPFVCHGSPADCDVFIVGTNPATASIPFWSFWSAERGFDYDAWLKEYQRQRQVSAGPRKRPAMSPTRRMITRFTQAIHAQTSHRVLETNVFATPTRRAADLADNARDTRTFEFLLRELKPRVLVVHGGDARELVPHLLQPNAGLRELPVSGRVLRPVLTAWGEPLVAYTPHFAYQWSAAKMDAFAQSVIEAL
jgi:hypothetical protein